MELLLDSFATVPGLLPTDAIAGLVAVTAAQTSPHSTVRRDLIRRSEVPLNLARTLIGPAPGREHFGYFLARPDVPVGDVLAELGTANTSTLSTLADQSLNSVVLNELATSQNLTVLRRVVTNDRTPTDAAAGAVAVLVDEQVRAEERNAAAGIVPVCTNGLPTVAYGWLRYNHSIRDEVIESWALTTTHLAPLTVAISARADLDRSVAAHAADLALAAIPDDVTDLTTIPTVLASLEVIVALKTARGRTLELLYTELTRRNLRVGRVAATKALHLADVSTTNRKPLDARAWRNTASNAKKDPAVALALLQDLTRLIGDDPDAWKAMSRLSVTHTGTVEELAQTAVGVAAPAAI